MSHNKNTEANRIQTESAERASSQARQRFQVAEGSLAGVTALVTGAGRGIGAAAACALAAAGAMELILVSRTRTELEHVATTIDQMGVQARVECCDLRDGLAIQRLIGALPRLDVLVNNAGMNIPALLV